MGVLYNYVNVGSWNIHGLFANIKKVRLNKLNDPEFLKRVNTFDILCLQEIQSGPKDTQPLTIEGYQILPFHRKISSNGRFYGGILGFVKKDIRAGIKVIDNLNGDKIWIRLKKKFFRLKRDSFVWFCVCSTLDYTQNLDYDIFSKD